MKNSFRIVLIAWAVSGTAASMCGKNGGVRAPEHTLSIRLYNQAHVAGGILELAIAEATRILMAAHLNVNWEQPSGAPPEAWINDMSPTSEISDERPYLVVSLRRATPAHLLPGALGFSLPTARIGVHATVFYDRVELLSADLSVKLEVSLGYTIAHEVGHVLLGSSQHSSGGLMQTNWNLSTWRLASAGLLTFRGEEIQRIGERLSARNRLVYR